MSSCCPRSVVTATASSSSSSSAPYYMSTTQPGSGAVVANAQPTNSPPAVEATEIVDSDLHMSTSATATAPGGGPGGGPGGAAAAGSVRPNAADFHNIMHNSLSNMSISAETTNNACGAFVNSAAMSSYPLATANATSAAPAANAASTAAVKDMSISSSSSTTYERSALSAASAASTALPGLPPSLSLSSSAVSSSSNSCFYDWASEENLAKWRGVFVHSLEKVLRQVHPTLMATEDALRYVEDLILRLLAMLTANRPRSVDDIKDRVSKTFPTPIDTWALTEAQAAISRGGGGIGGLGGIGGVGGHVGLHGGRHRRLQGAASHLVLPVDRVHPLLREVLQNSRDDKEVTVYLVAVLEYISADILKLVGTYVKNRRVMQVTRQDIKVAMCADKVLMDMFQQDSVLLNSEDGDPAAAAANAANAAGATGAAGGMLERQKKSQTYDEVVKDMILDEKQYLRDLQMITKVFREILQKDSIGSIREIDHIFSNVTDVMELTVTLITSLEDTLEMTEEGNMPAIGACFEELAEAEEFDVYEKYARDILSPKSRHTLDSLLPRQIVSDALRSCGKGFREAVKFYLPKLLLGPIYHCREYFNYIKILRKLTTSDEEKEILDQVSAMLGPLKNKLNQLMQGAGAAAQRKPGDIFHRGACRVSRQEAVHKLHQLQQSIGDWEGKELVRNSSELICEGKLRVYYANRKLKAETVDRYVYLCDGMIIICKQNSSHGHGGKRISTSSASSQQQEYRLKEKHLIRLVDVLDREDTETERHMFELAPREQSKIVFKAESEEEKNSWMAALVMLNTKFMLERLLDVILSNEEKKHPLRFPPSDKYRFAEVNSDKNIVFEDKEKSSGVPLIKGATLVKLVERLTYHVYADPMFMKTFLTTYRSFSTPQELLDLLIARFNIPEPEFSSDSESDSDHHGTASSASTTASASAAAAAEKTSKMRMALDLKRFRKEYSQPVQFRVLNVLKHWVDHHFYDFEQDTELLGTLNEFLNGSISGKAMRKWAECINKSIQRRLSNDDREKDIKIMLDRSPPPIERHLENSENLDSEWPTLLTHHPIEIARQLTLLEFEYYRAVKPSELVDLAWTRPDREMRAPNLLTMGNHTTNFTRYLEKTIVGTDNIEERVAVMVRSLEIMTVLQEYNNFNGVLAITSALNSSAVFRLAASKEKVPKHLMNAYEEASSYVEDHFKHYWAKLRSINPPCVPFFGQYQSNILFLEEGNPDFLHNTNLINFTKRRKVSEIISEIQQYQHQPYCLEEVPELRGFLETLEPFPNLSEKEVTDYLWERSIEIEPRNARRPLDGKPKWKGLSLRSPGTKPKNLPGKNHPNPLPRPKTSSRQSADRLLESPLTSPVFKTPSYSGPSTPLSPAPMMELPNSDPVKIPLNLPLSSPATVPVPPLVPIYSPVPPPLPPKPPSHRAAAAAAMLASSSSAAVAAPPGRPSRSGSPPPPLPPRTLPRGSHQNLSNAVAAAAVAMPPMPPMPPPPSSAAAAATPPQPPPRK